MRPVPVPVGRVGRVGRVGCVVLVVLAVWLLQTRATVIVHLKHESNVGGGSRSCCFLCLLFGVVLVVGTCLALCVCSIGPRQTWWCRR